MNDFDTFWNVYPRKVGRHDAMKVYAKAVAVASPTAILQALELYACTKSESAEWWQPTTFLQQFIQGRWADHYWFVPGQWRCRHNPPCDDRALCQSGTRDEADRRRGAR